MSKFIKPSDFAKAVFDSIKQHGSEYQEKTGCTDGQRALFESALLSMTAWQIELVDGWGRNADEAIVNSMQDKQ